MDRHPSPASAAPTGCPPALLTALAEHGLWAPTDQYAPGARSATDRATDPEGKLTWRQCADRPRPHPGRPGELPLPGRAPAPRRAASAARRAPRAVRRRTHVGGASSPGHAVIVTGGASGIGLATALALAASGRAVAIWDRDGTAARKVAGRCMRRVRRAGPGPEARCDQDRHPQVRPQALPLRTRAHRRAGPCGRHRRRHAGDHD